MQENQLFFKLALSMIDGVGPKNARQLVAYCGGVEAVFKEKKRLLEKIPGIGPEKAKSILKKGVLEKAEKELAFIQRFKINTHFYLDDAYPIRLNECIDAPLLMYTRGGINFNKQKIVSIVGTRNATRYGKDLTDTFVSDLAASYPDAIVVSGLAYGIDIQAHKAALVNGLETIAVLGSGLDKIYPALHKTTAKQIVDQGALVTEYPSGSKPDAQNFVKRNRIVAGMCDAVVVIETSLKGGSLITANLALSYNKDVFAFPGNIGEPVSIGCNNLIKTNRAGLIESFADLEFQMGWEKHKNVAEKVLKIYDASDEEQKLIQIIRETPEVHIGLLAKRANMQLSSIQTLLFEMELKGMVRKLPGNVFEMI